MFFWNSLDFSMIQQMLAIWSLVPLPFLKQILLKPNIVISVYVNIKPIDGIASFFFFLVLNLWNPTCEQHVSSQELGSPVWLVAVIFSSAACMRACSVTSVLSHSLWPYGTVAPQAPLSMEFSRQQYLSGLPCPSPGGLPNPRIEPMSLTSPASASGFFTRRGKEGGYLLGSLKILRQFLCVYFIHSILLFIVYVNYPNTGQSRPLVFLLTYSKI